MTSMKRVLLVLGLIFAYAVSVLPVSAEDVIVVVSSKFTNNFRRSLQFQLEATDSAAKIIQADLVVQMDGSSSGDRLTPSLIPDNRVQVSYDWNLLQRYLPPGATGQFWWLIEDSAGNKKQTAKQPFRVEDSKYQWKKISNASLAVYWYSGSDNFGKALFERGVEAMDYLQKDTGVAVDRQVQVWIYGTRNDFFGSLEPGAREWTGGRAFPDFSIIMINIEPSNLEWGKDAMAHELTHLVIHQKIRSPLGDLSMPHWLDEGLAMYYETVPGSLDSQFAVPLRRAIQNDALLTLRSIADRFGSDSQVANLAYAESFSVVDFIFRHYGKDKMAQLLQAFKTSGFYDDIFRKVLGVDTDGLEGEWRKDVGAKPRAMVTRAVTTPTAFPTFSLSTDSNPPPTTSAKQTTTRESVAQNATPVPPAPTSESRPIASPSDPVTSLCGGVFGFIALGLFGALRARSWLHKT